MSLDLCSQRLKSDKTYFDVFFWRTNEHQKNKNKKHTSTPNKGKATRLKTHAASHANCNDLNKSWKIVARFRPHYNTQPKKTRPKAKWALGRIFLSFGRVLKTRPQAHFFVVINYSISSSLLLSTTTKDGSKWHCQRSKRSYHNWTKIGK